MDIRVTLDISERAHAALVGIAEAFRDMVARGGYLRDECAEDAQTHAQNAENATEPKTEDEPEPAEQESGTDAIAAAPEPALESAPKRGRGRPPKKRESLAPEGAISSPAGNQALEPEKSPQEETSCDAVADIPAPVEPEKAPEKPAAPAAAPAEKADDPYHGMTLMQATQALLSEIADRGIGLGEANARIRKECEARGLPYGSGACLMKATDYDFTRKIAFGE